MLTLWRWPVLLQPFALLGSTGNAIAFGAFFAEASGVTEATLIDMSPFFRSGRCVFFINFLMSQSLKGQGALIVNVSLILFYANLHPSPPFYSALCSVQFLFLQAKHSLLF